MAIVSIICWCAFGVACRLIAIDKGREPLKWFWLGVLLGPIGLLYLLAQERDERSVTRRLLASGSMKKCPQCAELVKSEASVCRFCRASLPETPPEVMAARRRREKAAAAQRDELIRRRYLAVGGVALALAAFAAVSVVSAWMSAPVPEPEKVLLAEQSASDVAARDAARVAKAAALVRAAVAKEGDATFPDIWASRANAAVCGVVDVKRRGRAALRHRFIVMGETLFLEGRSSGDTFRNALAQCGIDAL